MNFRIRNVTVAAVTGPAMLALASAGDAHHSPVSFDRETPVTITGTVVRFEVINPHSFLFVRQQAAEGTVEWAVEGPSQAQLPRRGIDEAAFAPGETVEACGYLLKEGDGTGYAGGRAQGARVLLAEVMVMPDGEARLWSPYGNALCREQKGYTIAGR